VTFVFQVFWAKNPRHPAGAHQITFRTRTGPEVLYINDAYRDAFIAVRYGIELRLGLIVLSGESGVGKTSLTQRRSGWSHYPIRDDGENAFEIDSTALAETVIDTAVDGLAHVILSLSCAVECSIGGQGMQTRRKVDLTFPSP